MSTLTFSSASCDHQEFDHFDVDRGGSLSQEEVIRGLFSTFHVTTASEQQSIRDSIFNTWCLFDMDNSGSIDKKEFLMAGGMAESLIAMEQQRKTGRYGGGYNPQPPQRQQQQQQQHQQQRQQTQMMRVPVPQGMRAGQQLRVRSPGSGELVTVTIPAESRWVPNGGQYCFDIQLPMAVATPVIVQGTHVAPQAPPAYAPHYNNSGNHQMQQQQQQQLPWTSYYSFRDTSYQMPPLGMQRVSYPVPSPGVTPNGRKKALLIGINYKGSRAELRGCVNDVKNMKDLLQRNGFRDDPSSMIVLVDDNSIRGNDQPTKANIQKGLNWLVHNVVPGDVLFFHFSGHGAQVPDKTGHEADGFNETILPVDYKRSGEIIDDELWGRLVYKVPNGVRLTSVMDCCHSGTGLDLSFDYDLRSNRWKEDTNPAHSQGDVVLFSGCEDAQTSADVMDKYQAGGAMTNAFLSAYTGNDAFPRFLENVHYHLKKRGMKQRPQLTSSQSFDVYNSTFNITQGQICGNKNSGIGREKRRHIKPGKAGNNGGMNDLLFKGGAVLGAFALAGALFD